MTAHSNDRYMPAASYFLFGLAAGSALALLYTPLSGAETRGRIRRGVEDSKRKVFNEAESIRDKGEEIVKTATSHATRLVDAGKKRVTDQHHRIDRAFRAGKEAYNRS